MKAKAAVAFSVVAAAVLLAAGLYFALKPKQAGIAIPKIIWTFWHDAVLPPLVQTCIASWKRHHPDFQIIVLNAASADRYIDAAVMRAPWIDCLAKLADVIRLHVLEKYGGVWSDASIMLYGQFPLVARHFNQYEFMGYYLREYTTNPEFPVLEDYWFATIAGGAFISRWRQAFMSFLPGENVYARVQRFEGIQGVDTQALGPKKYYLLVDVAAQYVMQKQMSQREIKTSMLIADAEADDGPFHYIKVTGWEDRRKGLMRVLLHENTSPMVKFTAIHRRIMNEMGLDAARLQ